MLTDDEANKVARYIRAAGLTPSLRIQSQWFCDPIDREPGEPVPTLGEFVAEMFDRHQKEPDEMWLDSRSLDLIETAMIETRVVKRMAGTKHRGNPDFVFRRKKKNYQFSNERNDQC